METTAQSSDDLLLTGNRVILRPIHKDDLPTFLKWVNDPEISIFLNKRGLLSVEDEIAWYERSKSDPENMMDFTVLDKDTNRLIGTMGIHHMKDTPGLAWTGSIIGEKEYRERGGYGTEAKMLMLNYAFARYDLYKIYSYIKEFNKRSIEYAKKCGYVLESVMVNHYPHKEGRCARIIMTLYAEKWPKIWEDYKQKYNL